MPGTTPPRVGREGPAGGLDALDSGLLEALTGKGSLAFALFDDQLRFVRVSRAMAELDHVAVADHLGHSPVEVLPPALGAKVEAELRRVLRSGQPATDHQVINVPEWHGARRHDSRWLPVRDSAGHTIGAAMFVSDVTDRYRHVELLRSSQRRAARLQHVTADLASAVSLEDVRAKAAGLCRLIGAVHSEIRLLDDGPAAGGHATYLPAQRPWTHRWPPPGWPPLLAAAVRAGEPWFVSGRTTLPHQVADPGGQEAVTSQHAWAALPLVTSHGALGGLFVAYGEPHPFLAEDRALLSAIAGQCALAIERALLHDREHGQVLMLQHALLPERLPSPPGIRLAFRYLPGTPDTEVGGDWYDAFELPDGRLGMVVGDVIGKGLGAAASMGRVRAALRALAFTDPRPRSVLSGLDRFFATAEADESLTTLVYALVDRQRWHLDMADAGHLPLLVVSADGAVRYEDGGYPAATPLGWPEPRVERRVGLAPGDVVIGFSDGLVENRRRSLGEGLDELLTVAAGATGDVEAMLERLLRHMFDGYQRDDDVTLLGMCLTETA